MKEKLIITKRSGTLSDYKLKMALLLLGGQKYWDPRPPCFDPNPYEDEDKDGN